MLLGKRVRQMRGQEEERGSRDPEFWGRFFRRTERAEFRGGCVDEVAMGFPGKIKGLNAGNTPDNALK